MMPDLELNWVLLNADAQEIKLAQTFILNDIARVLNISLTSKQIDSLGKVGETGIIK